MKRKSLVFIIALAINVVVNVFILQSTEGLDTFTGLYLFYVLYLPLLFIVLYRVLK